MEGIQVSIAKFKKLIWTNYRANGRHDMPWRKTRDPYKILVSEVMLQQTQVGRVKPFYQRFIKHFPDFKALARANTRTVLKMWQGLGYNRRALNLQKLSKVILEDFNGKLPRKREDLESLPGIGPGTAGALRAFIFNEPEVFIETNIRRVFIHFFSAAISPKRSTKVTDVALERYIIRALDRENPREWYYALMDYGAMLGANGSKENVNKRSAHYKVQSRFEGSNRELRGKILRVLLKKKNTTLAYLTKETGEPKERIRIVMHDLVKEGFVA